MGLSLDADRYAHLKLQLVCPKCGTRGLIPWKQLDRLLFCSGCVTRFRVARQGLVELAQPLESRVAVQVRTNSSQWREHEAVISERTGAVRRLCARVLEVVRQRAKSVVAGCVVLVCVVAGYVTSARPVPPSPVELPSSLEGRAALFAEAVARRDMYVLIGLTDPSQHRALRIWLAHDSDLPRPLGDESTEYKVEVLSVVRSTAAGDRADVQIRLPAEAGGKPGLFAQQWVQRGETWYFEPVRRRTPALPRQPMNQINQRSKRGPRAA